MPFSKRLDQREGFIELAPRTSLHGRRRAETSPPPFWRLAVGLVFAGIVSCGGNSTPRITIAAGSLSGAWSAISEGLVSSIRKGLPCVAVTSEPGLDGANAALVAEGKVELGLVHSAMARLALRGEYPYSHKLETLRGLSLMYRDSAFHFLLNKNTGLKSIEDIKNKRYPLRLSVIYRGSLMEIASRTVLEAYGISYEDIESWGGKVYFRALRPSLDLMKDGRLDAVSLTVQFPQTLINEASRYQPLTLLTPSPLAVDVANKKLGTYRSTIPAEAYRFLDDDVVTFSDVVVLIANSNLSNELAYQISHSIHANLDYLHGVHKALSTLTPQELSPAAFLPLHPGSQQFFKEAGLLQTQTSP